MKLKRVRTNKGYGEQPKVGHRLVPKELGYGERLGELFAGTPSLTIAQLLFSVAAKKELAIMLLDVYCAFLHSAMRRNVYIDLPRESEAW